VDAARGGVSIFNPVCNVGMDNARSLGARTRPFYGTGRTQEEARSRREGSKLDNPLDVEVIYLTPYLFRDVPVVTDTKRNDVVKLGLFGLLNEPPNIFADLLVRISHFGTPPPESIDE